MRNYLNQKGLSLVEVLATLTLLTIVGSLVFGILINSLNIFKIESENIDIKREVNLISNQLTTFYKKYGDFYIEEKDNGIIVYTPNKENYKESREFSIQDYLINVIVTNGSSNNGYESKDIKIKITNIDDVSDSFELESNISRIKEG